MLRLKKREQEEQCLKDVYFVFCTSYTRISIYIKLTVELGRSLIETKIKDTLIYIVLDFSSINDIGMC
jgi:hypothetical protein